MTSIKERILAFKSDYLKENGVIGDQPLWPGDQPIKPKIPHSYYYRIIDYARVSGKWIILINTKNIPYHLPVTMGGRYEQTWYVSDNKNIFDSAKSSGDFSQMAQIVYKPKDHMSRVFQPAPSPIGEDPNDNSHREIGVLVSAYKAATQK